MLRPYTCPRAKSDLERREPSGTGGQRAVRVEQTGGAVGRNAKTRHRARAVAGIAEASVVVHNRPARSALMREDGAAHNLERAIPAQYVRGRRARSSSFGDEDEITRADRKAEWRTTRGCVRRPGTRDPVVIDRIDIEQTRALLGHDQLAPVRAEGDLGRTGSRAGEGLCGTGDSRQLAVVLDRESRDVARAAAIQNVGDIPMDRDADWLRSARDRAAEE